MSKFTTAAATSHTLSLAAMEEASRVGQRTADVDHLFLALVMNEQRAGHVLRGLGITLDSARDAIVEQHADQLASLGIEVLAPEPGRIVFHETGGYDWSARAVAIIKRANEGRKSGDAAAVLRELVTEPSGLIAAVLTRLGTTPDTVVTRLDEVESSNSHPTGRVVSSGGLSGTSGAFVPAPGHSVWELLIDPTRMPEWEPSIGSVDVCAEPLRVGANWTAHTRTERPNGKPLAVKPQFVAQRVEVIDLDDGHRIEWRFTYPDAPNSNAKLLTVELEPAAGGTQLRLSLTWELNPDRAQRPVLRRLLRPLMRQWTRYLIWMQLSHIGSSISRTLR